MSTFDKSFLYVVLILIIALVIISSLGLFSEGVVGRRDVISIGGGGGGSSEYCTDSDGGINPFVRGITSGRLPAQGEYYGSQIDSCSGISCNGDDCSIKEFYCKYSPELDLDFVAPITILCPYGCDNGVCLRDSLCFNSGYSCCEPGYGLGVHYPEYDNACFRNMECWENCDDYPPLTCNMLHNCCDSGHGGGQYYPEYDSTCYGDDGCWDYCIV